MSVGDASVGIMLEPLRHVSGLGANLGLLSSQQRNAVATFRAQLASVAEAQTLGDYLTDAALVRFLIARDWDCDKALKMAVGALQWRLKRMCHTWSLALEPEDAASSSENAGNNDARAREVALRESASTGKIRVAATPDRHGRAVMVLDNSRENCNDANAMVEYLAFNMELCARTAFVGQPDDGQPRADKIMLVLHMSDFSIFNQPPMVTGAERIIYVHEILYFLFQHVIKTFAVSLCKRALPLCVKAVTKETITILGSAFPESLGTAVVLNPPLYFTTFWALISPLIDPQTREKVYTPPNAEGDSDVVHTLGCVVVPRKQETRLS
jgi:hypothetical protein